ncbi:Hypothetical predicted protein [Mytilus galloprovincialis]|uniref:Uncharacterized protein n=1 Tax=Mytilus galloprovincialis TaxID=29158 RepID=A0A8B6EWD3_MYTGA|nr:Hypothetical predicted protein [Mytilus galloprovincialis]
MPSDKDKLKLKLNNKKRMDLNRLNLNEPTGDVNMPQSAQQEIRRPKFSEEIQVIPQEGPGNTVKPAINELRTLMEVKHNLNTIQEGLRLMEHPSKEHIKEKVRDIQQYLKTVALSQLSEALAKGIREVSKQLDDILHEADTKLQKSEKYDERRELFKAAQELIEEYSSKLQSYKDSLARKPTVAKPKDKFKKRF